MSWLRTSRLLNPVREAVSYLFDELGCVPTKKLDRCLIHGHLAMRRVGITGHVCAFCNDSPDFYLERWD